VATEAGLAEWEQFGKRRNKEKERKKRQNERKDLTLTGLLMEGATNVRAPSGHLLTFLVAASS
jgi:hypothetical protein